MQAGSDTKALGPLSVRGQGQAALPGSGQRGQEGGAGAGFVDCPTEQGQSPQG